MHLPRAFSAGSAGACDARIGRFCYWYDSTRAPAMSEPKQITAARDRLVNFLDSAAAINPADGWIAGQRTRYRIEARQTDEAIRDARQCRSEAWWCAALEGLALHVGERYAEAESAYAVALATMPATLKCEWLNLDVLLDDRLAREIREAGCAERGRLAERLWSMSKPLWSTHGNDLKTEHFARLTMASILARTANAHGIPWGDDNRELLVRYGWPESYTRSEPAPLSYDSYYVAGHEREPSYHFFPAVVSARTWPRLSDASWHLREPTARTRYAPRHVEGLGALAHQLMRFPRGDSMLVVVAFRARDTLIARDSIEAFLGVRRDSTTLAVRRFPADRTGVLRLTVPADTLLASVEVRGARSRRAERARFSVDPLPCRREWCVADLVLYTPAPDDSIGSTGADRALAAALTEGRHSAGEPLGVLWEVQGSGAAESVWLSLTVSPVKVSALRRVATRLRLAPESSPIRLRWQATLRSGLEQQLLTLHLPASARGVHRITLTVERAGGAALVSTREIEVVP